MLTIFCHQPNYGCASFYLKSYQGATDALQCHPPAFRASDPRCLPYDVRDLQDFGKVDMSMLANHYDYRKEDTFKGHTARASSDSDCSKPCVKRPLS